MPAWRQGREPHNLKLAIKSSLAKPKPSILITNRALCAPTVGNQPRKPGKPSFLRSSLLPVFLHAELKIKERCRRHKELLKTLLDKAWKAYQAQTKASFSQRLRRLREWARAQLSEGAGREAVLNLCGKAHSLASLPGLCLRA